MLTDTAIRKAKPTDKLQKLSDAGGLQLHIPPASTASATGAAASRLWRLAYRFEGKQKLMALGAYPHVGLAQAREARDAARKLLAQGVDPMQARHAAKARQEAASAHSFESVARQWHEHWKSARSDRHAQYVIARLEADVFPAIGARPVASIDAPELVRMVKAIEARGALDIAKRCLQMCSQVFRHAIAHGIGGASRNPAADIKPADVLRPRKKENFARIDARELPALLRKIEGYQGTPVTRLAMKLMALTFVRTGELIGARWEEFDLEAARWDIPAERMKMKTPHVVPLSTQAVEVLRVLQTVSGNGSQVKGNDKGDEALARDRARLLFPGERDHGKPMSNNTILKALERMGFKGRMTGHGFRGLASTILHERGFEHAHIELQLAHAERDEVSAAYNFATYLPQRRTLMQWWGDYLDAATRGPVVQLARVA
ncbi:tyrosine-type recombinase/integrase [Variovorax sp. GT1P44]|uniref:tyrosine-type recombinase/integrase n=1 Tax=Variovorax sp. GT1P44 TaxID=3443742 RepID=UPI003F463254